MSKQTKKVVPKDVLLARGTIIQLSEPHSKEGIFLKSCHLVRLYGIRFDVEPNSLLLYARQGRILIVESSLPPLQGGYREMESKHLV